jgi:hypothetical protein
MALSVDPEPFSVRWNLTHNSVEDLGSGALWAPLNPAHRELTCTYASCEIRFGSTRSTETYRPMCLPNYHIATDRHVGLVHRHHLIASIVDSPQPARNTTMAKPPR